jgi:hypothetical protein
MRVFHAACIAIAALGLSCAQQPLPRDYAMPRSGMVTMHLDADEDARNVWLYRETPTGWQEVCVEPCDKRIDASGTYMVDRHNLRRSRSFVLTGPPSDSASLTLTTRKPRAALWVTGVTALVLATVGAAIIADCNARETPGQNPCARNSSAVLSLDKLPEASFLASGSAAGAFLILLLVPSSVHVTYPNGQEPLRAPSRPDPSP